MAVNGRLLERDREIASLEALIDGAAGGEARLALVEGPAGIGKTRLVAEARRLPSAFCSLPSQLLSFVSA